MFDDVEALHWRGPTKAFEKVAGTIGDARLASRVEKLVRTAAESGVKL